MADIPDTVVLRRDLELRGREWHIWIRRGLVGLFAAISIAALANVFGQATEKVRASGPVADLTLDAPTTVRGGLLWQARFEIDAKTEVKDARLVLGRAWATGHTINTIEPSPIGEASAGGDLSFDLGHIRAGRHYTLFMDFQTNPTFFGVQHRTTDLYDGDTHLLSIDQSVTTFP
jgi:hypothetical protein